MKSVVKIFCIVFAFAFTYAERKPDHVLESTANLVVTDNLANVYLVKNDQFIKYDSKLVKLKEFSNKNFGSITSADVNNPLRILLFYRDFGRVLFLDNTLSQNGDALAMENLGFPMATLAASSFDNGLWIYDQPSFELVRFNTNLEISGRTGNLSQILGIELQPNFILEKDNRVFLNNPTSGILVFDVFGTYIKTIPILRLNSFQVADDEIIYFAEGTLKSWNLKTAETSVYEEPQDARALNMRIERDAIIVHDSASISTFIRHK
jgi:hypothetical protein